MNRKNDCIPPEVFPPPPEFDQITLPPSSEEAPAKKRSLRQLLAIPALMMLLVPLLPGSIKPPAESAGSDSSPAPSLEDSSSSVTEADETSGEADREE